MSKLPKNLNIIENFEMLYLSLIIYLISICGPNSELINDNVSGTLKTSQESENSKNDKPKLEPNPIQNCSNSYACGHNSDCYNGNNSVICLCKCGYAGNPYKLDGCVILEAENITRFEFGIKIPDYFPKSSVLLERLNVELANLLETSFRTVVSYVLYSFNLHSKG